MVKPCSCVQVIESRMFLLQVMHESIYLHLVKATTKKVQIYHTFIKQVSLCWEINHAAHYPSRFKEPVETLSLSAS